MEAVEAADGGVEATLGAGAGEEVTETGGVTEQGVGGEAGGVLGAEVDRTGTIEGLLNPRQTL